jgi:ATP-dependent Clp protease ATP-binding subunit ClpC
VFERFTDRARRVVVLAQEEARRLNHNYIGTEHLLLGLIREGEGVAAKALESLGISLEAVRQQVEEIIGRGQSAPTGPIPFTPRAKKVLELSLREALEFGHNYIGTEHLLLGLIREREGVGAEALEKCGAVPEKVRTEVISILAGHEPEPQPGESTPSLGGGPEDPPLCPRCHRRLSETLAWRMLEIAAEGEGEKRRVTVAFCRSCGVSIGTVP